MNTYLPNVLSTAPKQSLTYVSSGTYDNQTSYGVNRATGDFVTGGNSTGNYRSQNPLTSQAALASGGDQQFEQPYIFNSTLMPFAMGFGPTYINPIYFVGTEGSPPNNGQLLLTFGQPLHTSNASFAKSNGQTGQPAINATTSVVGGVTWFFPANSGIPQYFIPLQGNNGNNAKGFPALMDPVLNYLGNDGMGCFGTFLENSCAQTARCIQNTVLASQYYPQVFTDSNQQSMTSMPQFSIADVYFVATQVIIPDEITSQILEAATYGDISIQSHTIMVYNNIQLTPGAPSQNIVIPAKVASANALYGIFRTNEQTAFSMKQYLVNSLSGICPIGSSVLSYDNVSYIGTNNIPNSGNGTQFVSGLAGTFSFQLKIGNDLVPLQPITSVTELLCELEKTTHGLQARYNNMSFNSPIFTAPSKSVGGSGGVPGDWVYDIFTNGGYCTTYVDPFMLQDQTIVNNANYAYLTAPPPNFTNPDNLNYSTFVTDNVYYNNPCILTDVSPAFYFPVPVGAYCVQRFVHPDSTFMVGFDLDTWSGMSNVAQSGRYLGNNNTSLMCDGLTLVANLSRSGGTQGTANTVNFTAMILVDCRWSFQAGGNSQVFV